MERLERTPRPFPPRDRAEPERCDAHDLLAPIIAAPTFADIERAAARIEPFIRRTPVLTSPAIDEAVGTRVHMKAEHLQHAGAFKMRGASNAVHALDEETARRGVAAHSSGNHAAALARAATTRGIPCWVVMPHNTPAIKQEATRRDGAAVVLCEPTMEARAEVLRDVLDRTGSTEIHPYNHPEVVAGQGTLALELLEQAPQIEMIVAPVSGGGLMSGIAIATHGVDPAIELIGAEPDTVADAQRSLAAGELRVDGNTTSIADGLLAVLSPFTFAILAEHVADVVTVSDDDIIDAMALLFRSTQQVVEPSGATSLAALRNLARQRGMLPDDVGIVLSGGNVDRGVYPSVFAP